MINIVSYRYVSRDDAKWPHTRHLGCGLGILKATQLEVKVEAVELNERTGTKPRHAVSDADERLLRRGLLLEYVTLGWNVAGTVIVVAAAVNARSVALAGFGLDSLIEIVASIVVVWQLTGAHKHREERALRLIGAAFFALALYILAQEAFTIVSGLHPRTSAGGIAWLAASLVAMLLLAWGKRVVGRQLDNPVVQTESHVTLIDALLAAAVLAGLLLNATLGWWWADPCSGLVILYYAVKEGRAAWAHP